MTEKGAAIEAAPIETEREPLVWVEKYADYLFRFALARVRDRAAAEDLVQETFLAAVAAQADFAARSSAKTWLTGILKNKIYDHFRRAARQTDLTPEEADFSAYDKFFEREDEWNGHWSENYAPVEWTRLTPAAAFETAEFQTVLNNCLAGLPERIANAFVMREVDGLSGEEICRILMISANNYWTMMHRARLHLRRCLEINWITGGKRKAR